MMMMGSMGGWGTGLAAVGTVLLLVAIAAGVVLLVRRPGPADGRGPAPRDLPTERFARGAIDEQEYRRRLDVLDETEETDHRPRSGR